MKGAKGPPFTQMDNKDQEKLKSQSLMSIKPLNPIRDLYFKQISLEELGCIVK